jgi:hypothetical protein
VAAKMAAGLLLATNRAFPMSRLFSAFQHGSRNALPKTVPEKTVVVFACLVTVTSFFGISWAYMCSRVQDVNLEKAAAHIALIQPSLDADPRLKYVKLFPFTAHDGCLKVDGFVDSEQALDDLRRIVAKSNPPVLTTFSVAVIPENSQ